MKMLSRIYGNVAKIIINYHKILSKLWKWNKEEEKKPSGKFPLCCNAQVY